LARTSARIAEIFTLRRGEKPAVLKLGANCGAADCAV
jgi:hypothetical protein